jgi:hypothetical protein
MSYALREHGDDQWGASAKQRLRLPDVNSYVVIDNDVVGQHGQARKVTQASF